MSLQRAFKNAMARVPAAVVVVTAASGSIKRGVTCSSFSHVSLIPPIISFSLGHPSRFHEMLKNSDMFAVHMLSKHQVVQSMHFSSNAFDESSMFDAIPHSTGPKGVPLLKDTAAIFLCSPNQNHLVGDHHVWFGKVEEVFSNHDAFAEPLLYYSKTYRSIGDDSFVTAFEQTTLPFKEWTHKAHIRMAWIYVSEFGKAKGTTLIKNGIKRFNEHNKDVVGKSGFRGYHETVTEFYIHMVAHSIEMLDMSKRTCPFDEFIAEMKHLLDTKLIFQYYSPERIFSDIARANFASPDLKPLPQLRET